MQPNRAPLKMVVSEVVLILLLLGSLGFGYWAFTSRQDYKNNSDKKSQAAVEVAKTAQAVELQASFDEQEKEPNKTFKGPATYGSLTFKYPKTWSAYFDNTSQPLDGYFYPDVVPNKQANTAYSLRVELVDATYKEILQQFTTGLTDKSIKASAYIPPLLKDKPSAQVGTKLVGAVSMDEKGGNRDGEMVVIKIRDKTLKIYTESPQFTKDFEKIILASLTFEP
jgi:hypothetical protein